MISPFEFQRPLDGVAVLGRDEEIDTVVEHATDGRPLLLTAPRRYGKTSLLRAAQHRLQSAGHAVVYVDLYGIGSAAEFAIRLEAAWRQVPVRWHERAARLLRTADVGVQLGGPGLRAVLSRRPDTDPTGALHTLLDLPVRLADDDADERVVVILDEFQALGVLDGIEGLLRSHVQHHAGVAGYVFAGSEPHLLAAAFEDPDRPFYGQTMRLRLDRPSRSALADIVSDGLQRHGRHPGDILDALLDRGRRHPQRTMMLAHFLFLATSEGQVAGPVELDVALAAARDHVRDEVHGRYDALTTNQKQALRLVAHDLSAYRGQPFVSLDAGSVSATLRQLRRDGLLESDGDDDRFVDPMLADWIRTALPL